VLCEDRSEHPRDNVAKLKLSTAAFSCDSFVLGRAAIILRLSLGPRRPQSWRGSSLPWSEQGAQLFRQLRNAAADAGEATLPMAEKAALLQRLERFQNAVSAPALTVIHFDTRRMRAQRRLQAQSPRATASAGDGPSRLLCRWPAPGRGRGIELDKRLQHVVLSIN
jgi:hypothetical protein